MTPTDERQSVALSGSFKERASRFGSPSELSMTSLTNIAEANFNPKGNVDKTMSNFVFVLDSNKKPLLPCKPCRAGSLLKHGKAKVFKRCPFTIILNKQVEEVTESVTLKIDPGSKTTGIALVQCDRVVFGMELNHRGGLIKKSLDQRRAIRRGRRNRNTRYRQARFLNRRKQQGWLAPSLQHRVLTTMTWVRRLMKSASVSVIVQELVRFDMQQCENPEITGVEYQQGELAGYEVREYLLEKWGRKCAYCDAENAPMQIEHIQPRASGGTNRVSNLCLACHKCNQKKSDKPIEVFLAKKPERIAKIKSQAKRPLKDAAAVNITRWALFNALKTTDVPVSAGTGGRTKWNRTRFGLPKAHWIDAACVGNIESIQLAILKPLTVTCRGQGGRQKAALNKYGYPTRHNQCKPIKGWRNGDIAKFGGIISPITPRSNGSFGVTIAGEPKSIPVRKLMRIHKMDGFKYS
jgi:5-methylcytosine-specific restriction endonuclease McrA